MTEETKLKKMKAYIIYGGGNQMLNATLIFENGWSAFSHLCSHPGFMAGDLIEDRPERREILKRMGIGEVEIVGEPIWGSANAPAGLLEKNKDRSNWQAMSDEYKKIREEIEKEKESQQ